MRKEKKRNPSSLLDIGIYLDRHFSENNLSSRENTCTHTKRGGMHKWYTGKSEIENMTARKMKTVYSSNRITKTFIQQSSEVMCK